jgi:hypothetical protein
MVVAVAAGCGGSPSTGSKLDSGTKRDGSGSAMGSADAALYDFGCGGNTACALDTVCCAMPGPTTTFSCVAPASCPAADKIVCDGPDECGGANPICCGVYAGDGTGNYPQCGIASLGTSCTTASACPTHLESTCSDTTKVTICHVKADCTDASYPECCTFTSGGAMLTFCIDSFTASVGGATCQP